jgi:hypothetical protein
LSAEDPQLDFYLNELEWTALARDAGLSHLRWEANSPLFSQRDTPTAEYVEVASRRALEDRFKAFARFYFDLRNEHYSLDAEAQATVHHFRDAKLLVVGLNSAWAIDHRHPGRAGIHSIALGARLRRYGPRLTVHTRRRENPEGAWTPDARWTSGLGADPLPRYVVDL